MPTAASSEREEVRAAKHEPLPHEQRTHARGDGSDGGERQAEAAEQHAMPTAASSEREEVRAAKHEPLPHEQRKHARGDGGDGE